MTSVFLLGVIEVEKQKNILLPNLEGGFLVENNFYVMENFT